MLYDLAATHPGKLGSLHGGGIYAEAVFENLLKIADIEDFEVFYFSHKPLPENVRILIEKHAITQHTIHQPADIQNLIDSDKYHTLYSAMPYELFKSIDTQNIRFVYTIHGLREIEVPYSCQQWRYSLNWKRLIEWLWASLFTTNYLKSTKERFRNLLTKPNSEVITISRHSKYSILNQFGDFVKENALTVLYSPLMNNKLENPNNIESPLLDSKYFLIINGNRWIKNSYRALIALENFYRLNPECEIKTLVLGIQTPPTKFSKNKRFIFKGYVSREELESSYANAFAFIYPTLNEGFGYPPLEAMRYGTPVLASAIAAVPEVCADAALYFNPYDVNEMTIRISEVYFNENLRAQLIMKGHRRVSEMDTFQSEMLDTLCKKIIQLPA